MSAIAEWDQEFTLTTPQGTIAFNYPDPTDGFFLLTKEDCAAAAAIRAEKFDKPQLVGSYLRRRFTTGYVVNVGLSYWSDPSNPACESSLISSRAMNDTLMRHLRSILNGGGRLRWTPTGTADRILDDLWLLESPSVKVESGLTTVSFTLDTEFPYAIDYTQITTSFTDGSPTFTLNNTGTAPFFPVWKIYGPTYYCRIVNNTTGEEFVYDASLPSSPLPITGGNYLEINTFRNTAYLNGNSTNYKSAIDIELSEFFPLEVGNNSITIHGTGTFAAPDVDCLWQAAWF